MTDFMSILATNTAFTPTSIRRGIEFDMNSSTCTTFKTANFWCECGKRENMDSFMINYSVEPVVNADKVKWTDLSKFLMFN